ncbi:MAG: hypothetical protein A3I02_08055 [Betaproteobacteria bacterium RIFCSPLOWO2_02_FULL_67_26]|nr:MAG: hypothetical protein A3I02_08055 [Betaproteobacteria bacterium RIFCSPLOWO2_02_FULL_67_26]
MERELRILQLEDSPTDARIIEDRLHKDGLAFSARRVETREDFIRGLEEFEPDIVLADYNLPAFDGLAAVRIARERRPDIPVIVVTGSLGDERAVELLHEGARDYVLKERLTRLASAVGRALDEARIESEKREAEQLLHKQLDELRRFQKATIDRELHMKALKEENQRLRDRLAARGKDA